MHTQKVRTIAIGLVLILAVIVAPHIRIVTAIGKDATIDDITWDDFGIEGHYTFSNVTYNTDGTGTDVLDAGSGSSLAFEGQNSFSGKLHTAMGIGVFGPAVGSGAGIASENQLWTYDELRAHFSPAGGGAAETNKTTSEELFDYNEKERYDTGGHDFSTDFDSDTTWYNKNVSTAANAFNISSEYQELNASLTDTADLDIDDYFNNAGDNAESKTSIDYYNQHIKGETFVVGYEEVETGVINDLRSYLALVENKDYDDIVITNYNLSTAKISYNMSEDLTAEIRDAVDYWLDQGGTASALMLTIFDVPVLSWGTSTARLGGSGSDIIGSIAGNLNNIGKSMKSGFVSFGTKLKQFGTSATNWVGQKIQAGQKTASKAYHTVGGTIKSALSGAQKTLANSANFVVDVGKSVGTGVKNLAQKAVHCVQSVATGLVKVFTNPIFLIVLLIVVAVVGYFILKKTEVL